MFERCTRLQFSFKLSNYVSIMHRPKLLNRFLQIWQTFIFFNSFYMVLYQNKQIIFHYNIAILSFGGFPQYLRFLVGSLSLLEQCLTAVIQ